MVELKNTRISSLTLPIVLRVSGLNSQSVGVFFSESSGFLQDFCRESRLVLSRPKTIHPGEGLDEYVMAANLPAPVA